MDNESTQDGSLISLVSRRKSKIDSTIMENKKMKAAKRDHSSPPPPEPPPAPAPPPVQPVVHPHPQMVPVSGVVPEFRSKPRADDYVRHTFYAQERGIKELKYWALIDDRGQSEILREAMDDWLRKRQAAELS